MRKYINKVSWIAADWGTTHMRAWAMDEKNNILAYSESDKGMKYLQKNEFEPVLFRLIESWLIDDREIPIITCGMVGARQGWVETPYNVIPCLPINKNQLTFVTTKDSRIKVALVRGIMQSDPPDIMRGEETQISGFLESNSGFSGIICLPGTHTKWVKINKGVIEEFTTFMTGELFGVISLNTLLAHSINAEGWHQKSFEKGVEIGYKNPGSVASSLFSLRSKSIISNLNKDSSRAMLSGILIGVELEGSQNYWIQNKITLIGSGTLVKNYQNAIQSLGGKSEIFSVEKATIAGLVFAYKQFLDS